MKKIILGAALAVVCLTTTMEAALACPVGFVSGKVCVASKKINGVDVCLATVSACVRVMK